MSVVYRGVFGVEDRADGQRKRGRLEPGVQLFVEVSRHDDGFVGARLGTRGEHPFEQRDPRDQDERLRSVGGQRHESAADAGGENQGAHAFG